MLAVHCETITHSVNWILVMRLKRWRINFKAVEACFRVVIDRRGYGCPIASASIGFSFIVPEIIF